MMTWNTDVMSNNFQVVRMDTSRKYEESQIELVKPAFMLQTSSHTCVLLMSFLDNASL
jgi:hypothetical protein